jgi:hypothetical protein
MKKNYLIIIISVFVSLICSTSFIYAQKIKVDTIITTKTRIINIVTVRTVPKFILQFNASYLAGSMELTAHNGGFSYFDFTLGKSFCARNGLGFNLSGKLPLIKSGLIWLDASAYYNRFQSNLIASNTTEGKVSYNVFGGAIGADYMFTPTHKVKYFLGANVLFSSIGGNASLVSPVDNSITNVTIKPGFRIGYSFFVGLEYAFDKSYGINIGLKYSHLNLLLKNTSTVSTNLETSLNDNSVMPSQIYSGWKQFAYSSVFAGISYYFGVKEQRYKLP